MVFNPLSALIAVSNAFTCCAALSLSAFNSAIMSMCSSSSELDRLAKGAETGIPAEIDPEPSYSQGAVFAYCGKKNAASHVLKTVIERNYCAYTALQTDPLFVKLRGITEFNKLLSAAKECQNRFLAKRDQTSH